MQCQWQYLSSNGTNDLNFIPGSYLLTNFPILSSAFMVSYHKFAALDMYYNVMVGYQSPVWEFHYILCTLLGKFAFMGLDLLDSFTELSG